MRQNNVINSEVIVPRDRYYVLGDNRDDSSDSRYWGFVAIADLIGKPLLIYDSREMPPTLTRLALTIGKPRWNRLFKLL
jgi:signal peptidase I